MKLTGSEALKLQVRTIGLLVYVEQPREIYRAFGGENLPCVQIKVDAQAVYNFRISIGFNFHAHSRALTPVVQFGAHCLQQIARVFFLQVEVAVASDAKCGRRNNVVATIHFVRVQGD